jgi:hypothetical protein
MGTSSASNGPRSGIPIVPPWAAGAELPAAIAPTQHVGVGAVPPQVQQVQANPANAHPPVPHLLAQVGRFSAARRSAGEYGANGDRNSLKRSVGHHIRSGYGGSRTYASRMARVAGYAGGIYDAFSKVGQAGGYNGITRDDLVGKPANAVCASLLDHIFPMDGSLDADLGRDAFYGAVSEYMDDNGEFNSASFTDSDIGEILKRFIAECVYQRAFIDLHNAVVKSAESLGQASGRIRDMRDFIKEEVYSRFNEILPSIQRFNANSMTIFTRDVIEKTARVFEEYL